MGIFKDLSNSWEIFKKDLRLESRQKFELMSMVIFSISAVLIFAISLDLNTTTTQATEEFIARVTSASLWVIFIFAGMLSFTSVFGRELKSGGGGLTAIRSFPVKPQSIFLGKLLFNLTILFSVQFFIVSIYVIFFQMNFKLPIYIVILILLIGTLDYACIGTLVSALTLYSRAKTLVVPILIFPLIIPSVMLSVGLLKTLILGTWDQTSSNNFSLLFLHFVIILMISFLSIETILQD